MAKLKMLKLPKQPKLPRKPKQSASVTAKKNWLRRVQDVKQKYQARVQAIRKENAHRESENRESQRLNTVISGISGVKVFTSGFSAKVTHRRKKTATGRKRRHAKKASVKRGKRVKPSFKTHKWIKGKGWRKKR